jgi:DinB family protein
MAAPQGSAIRTDILAELATTRAAFHALLTPLSEADLRKPSHNPSWTNGEILFHMTFGFILILTLAPLVRLFGRLPKRFSHGFARLLNGITGFFNWFNALGPRLGGKVFTRNRIGGLYDWVYRALVRLVNSMPDDEWDRGMYYPDRWDTLFSDYMTLEQVLRYPTRHFIFHQQQIATDKPSAVSA